MSDKTTFSIQINDPIVKQLVECGLTPVVVYEPSYGAPIVEFIVSVDEKVKYMQQCVSRDAGNGCAELDVVSTRTKTI